MPFRFKDEVEGTKERLEKDYQDYLENPDSLPIILLLDELDRSEYDFVITCLKRTQHENDAVGGSKNSKHLTMQAVDIRSKNLEESAVSYLKEACRNLNLKLIDERSKAARPHFHIETTTESVNFAKEFSRTTELIDSGISKYVDAEDIIRLEDNGLLEKPFAYIHFPDGSFQKIRVPVFRVGLSILEIICRVLNKYGYEVHVTLDPLRNNLLPLNLNSALLKFIASPSQSGFDTGSFSVAEVRDGDNTYLQFFGKNNANQQIANLIEISDSDYSYFADPNFCHFNTTTMKRVKKKVSEIYPFISQKGTTTSSQREVYLYKKVGGEGEGYVDTIFVTNYLLEETELFQGGKEIKFKRLSGNDEVTLSIVPKVFAKDYENDIDFCTRICASVGASLVTAIKSSRVDIIDYVSTLKKFEPVVFVLPRPDKPLYVDTYQRPILETIETEETKVYPFSVDAFNKVMEQYTTYNSLSNEDKKLVQLSLPIWDFSADIDLNAMGSGFVETSFLNQNISYSKVFTLRKSADSEETFRFSVTSKDPDTLLMVNTFFSNPKLVEKLFNEQDFYKRIIANTFTEIKTNERDLSLPPLVQNAINWKISFKTFGIPFFQPGGCYEVLNFLPEFLYKNIAFAPGTSIDKQKWRWRWRCVEVTHNLGYPYTMDVVLSV